MQNYENLCMGCMADNEGDVICRHCGFDHSQPQPDGCLSVRSVVDNRYLIGRTLESGADGNTYLAFDMQENIQVRLREFMPQSYCVRGIDGNSIDVLPEKSSAFFEKRDEFLDIARLLARMSELPALFPVTDIFESNGTAYYACENVKSITLREFLLRNSGALTWEQFEPLILPVVTTLDTLNNNGLLHLGISPETLVVGKDGAMRIVGFTVSGARNTRSDISSQVYPGFTPVEQYADDETATESADVYALAATIFRTLVGQAPPESTDRVTNDRMIIPARIVQTLPKHVLTTLAGALAILPEDRTATLSDFRREMFPGIKKGAVVAAGSKPEPKANSNTPKFAILAIVLTAIIVFALGWISYEYIIKPNMEAPVDKSSDKSAPVSSVTSYDPVGSTVTYLVTPDFTQYTYTQLMAEQTFVNNYTFEIVEMKYDEKLPYGKVYEQSIKAGTKQAYDPENKIKVTIKISKGSSTVKLDDYSNKTYDEVYIALLEKGFRYNNIKKDYKYSTTTMPSTETQEYVVDFDYKAGDKVPIDGVITIYVNSYKPVSNLSSDATSSTSTSSATSSNQ